MLLMFGIGMLVLVVVVVLILVWTPFRPDDEWMLEHGHLLSSHFNDNMGDLRAAQSFARHSSPLTTAIYTRTTQERLEAAALSLNY